MAYQSIFDNGWETGRFESSGGVFGGSNIISYPSSSGSMTYNGMIIYRPGYNDDLYYELDPTPHLHGNYDEISHYNSRSLKYNDILWRDNGNVYHRPYEYVSQLRNFLRS